jgi:murein hydrolase activator
MQYLSNCMITKTIHLFIHKNYSNMLKSIFTTAFIVLLCFFANAQKQTREELERQRKQLQNEIEEYNKTLSNTKSDIKVTLGTLSAIKNKIDKREQVVSTISTELNVIDDDIYLTNREVSRLRRDLDSLKSDYAKSIIYAYKSKSSYSFLNFLFDAQNFADAFKRYQYLKNFRVYREMQAATITRTKQQLENKVMILDVKKKDKGTTLEVQTQQLTELEQDKQKKDNVVKQLKSREKEISGQLQARVAQRKKVNQAIAAIIKKEIEEARAIAKAKAKADAEIKRKADEAAALAKKKAAANNNNGGNDVAVVTPKPPVEKPKKKSVSELDVTPEGLIVSEKFENNRGSLPWPVGTGQICSHYGPNHVEGTSINEPNDGISICTQVGANVKCVFEGEISGVTDLGGEFAIIIKHGRYFTAYSHLSSTSVSRGQKVTTGQSLGKAAVDEESGGGRVDFMISTERGFDNPERWLKH